MADVSIIIPCYNHGHFLKETLMSVGPLVKDGTAEVIVVNDGSTDAATIQTLAELEKEGWRILHQENRGLSEARNTGIRSAQTSLILPLDSDNLIIPDFVRKATGILFRSAEIDIVYPDCMIFSDVEHYQTVGPFDPCRLINDNYIDACAIFRKTLWDELGGYDKNLPGMGHEDWDFWVRALMAKKIFYYLPMAGFRYRVREDSMLRTVTRKMGEENRRYIYAKHHEALFQSIHRSYIPASENYKAKYLRLQQYLRENRLVSLAKLLLNRPFY